MTFLAIGFVLAALAIGGPVGAAMFGIGGIAFIFYLNFRLGPKLTLIAIPVAIFVFICMWLDDFVAMYTKHLLIYVPICFIATAIICKIWLQEHYKHIVIGITLGFMVVTMAGLSIWMYAPRQFPVPKKTDTIQIQQMSDSVQAVFPNTTEMQELLEKLDKVEMRGTFEELTDFKGIKNTYRLTLLKQNGKEIDTYYFISKYYVAKKKGKRLVFYRWHDDNRFPYERISAMYNNVVHSDS